MPYRKNRKRVFISCPFGDRSFTEIGVDMDKAMTEYICKLRPEDREAALSNIDWIHNYYVSKRVAEAAARSKHPKLIYLAEAIRKMASCDEVIFAGDWEHANGCAVERLVYERYFQKENSES